MGICLLAQRNYKYHKNKTGWKACQGQVIYIKVSSPTDEASYFPAVKHSLV